MCLATLLHCKLKHIVARITTSVTLLSPRKIQCYKSRQHVGQTRLEVYFLQQILILLLVLPLKLQLVSQQIWIQRLWLAVAKRCRRRKQIKHGGRWKQAWIRSRPCRGYHSLRDTSLVPSKQAAKKAKSLEELSQKYNFSLSYLKQHWPSYWKNFAGREN